MKLQPCYVTDTVAVWCDWNYVEQAVDVWV